MHMRYKHVILTFILLGWVYLNFSAWFMKNTLFKQKKVEFWNRWHFVENKTEILQHVLIISIA
jgi:hypothetical protein